jgi:hypothetical protein
MKLFPPKLYRKKCCLTGTMRKLLFESLHPPAETLDEIPYEPSVPVFDLEEDQLTENSEMPIKKLQKYYRRTLQSATTARPSTAASPPPKLFSRPPTAKTTGLSLTTTNFTQEPTNESSLKLPLLSMHRQASMLSEEWSRDTKHLGGKK